MRHREASSIYLSILSEGINGGLRWSIPHGAVIETDASQYHAGVRVLEETLGLKEGQWRKWVSRSHATTAPHGSCVKESGMPMIGGQRLHEDARYRGNTEAPCDATATHQVC